MKKKDFKKLIVPMASVLAVGIGAGFGLTDGDVSNLEAGITALGTAIVTILGAVGVWKNNDKE